MSKRTDIESELTRLRNATPTKVEAFAAKRAARIAELEALLLTTPEDAPPPDPKVEAALRFAGGGDRFDRRR